MAIDQGAMVSEPHGYPWEWTVDLLKQIRPPVLKSSNDHSFECVVCCRVELSSCHTRQRVQVSHVELRLATVPIFEAHISLRGIDRNFRDKCVHGLCGMNREEESP